MIILSRYLFVLLLLSSDALANDGERLAYLQHDGEYWQVFVNDENGHTKQISHTKYDKSAISWLANGSNVFACGIQADAEIIDIKTGASKKINLPKHNINDAVISADGNKIIYSYISSGTTDNKLWLYDVPTKDDRPLLANMQGRQYDPKWNVKGDVFYFTSGFANQSYAIAKSTPGSNKSEIVIQNSKLNLDADVSANGDLAYSSNIKNSFDIWIKQSDRIKQLTNTSDTDSHPSWSSKSDAIYYARVLNGISNIWRLKLTDNAVAEQITNSKIGARYPVVFKGGKH